MNILIAPLNWGLGHASRCVPLIDRYLAQGARVTLGGDGQSLAWLRHRYPDLPYVDLAPLRLHYSRSRHQVGTLLLQLPHILRWIKRDHKRLLHLQELYHWDIIISDNRFSLHCPTARCIYLTHQLRIRLPHGWRWGEGLAHAIHARLYHKYNEIWVPDWEDPSQSLSGWLSHGLPSDQKVHYIGPLSRFPISDQGTMPPYDVVAVLSGLEPQRSLMEQDIRHRYQGRKERVLIVQGLIQRPATTLTHNNITTVPHLKDAELQAALRGADHIIARSGYSTLMDLDALGLLAKAELIPTPGQSEQEYLAQLHAGR